MGEVIPFPNNQESPNITVFDKLHLALSNEFEQFNDPEDSYVTEGYIEKKNAEINEIATKITAAINSLDGLSFDSMKPSEFQEWAKKTLLLPFLNQSGGPSENYVTYEKLDDLKEAYREKYDELREDLRSTM